MWIFCNCLYFFVAVDVLLDTSLNPRSPTSSVTSQRKLEWDSLADVGYANESDRKNSASSLSTLERLALKQQYSNNDSEKTSHLGLPTAHSTPLDENHPKNKLNKGLAKKNKSYKDVDFVEVNIPQTVDSNASQFINVNLTKHISFNMQKDGAVILENFTKDLNVHNSSPDKEETETISKVKIDKEIQTSLKRRNKSISSDTSKKGEFVKMPIIRLNTLKKRNKWKKVRATRKRLKSKKLNIEKSKKRKDLDRSGEHLSEAESFEYMPGYIYNQNHLKLEKSKALNAVGNKSSLESSGLPTTDSSKSSKQSFKKDLEKSLDLLKTTLQQRYNDDNLKTKLIKEVVQRLLKSKYKDEDSTTEFLSGLSFKSKDIGFIESDQTTSTSDGNILDKVQLRPKKSILRLDKFNSNTIASTSQSAPNLPLAADNDKPYTSNLIKSLSTLNTETDASSRDKMSPENGIAKTSSEELYQKYLNALKKEDAYKKHLKDKEFLLKQKLRSSSSAPKIATKLENKVEYKMKELLQDLIRNNYDDGSGDAKKTADNSNYHYEGFNTSQRSHSVFTLSSSYSKNQSKKSSRNKCSHNNIIDKGKSETSKRNHYCCCPYHSSSDKGVTDSSIQVDIRELQENIKKQVKENVHSQIIGKERSKNVAHFVSDAVTGDVRYVCLCDEKVDTEKIPDNYLIYKCSRLTNKGIQSDDFSYNRIENDARGYESNISATNNIDQLYQASCSGAFHKDAQSTNSSSENISIKKPSKSSQTNLLLKMLYGKMRNHSVVSLSSNKDVKHFVEDCSNAHKKKIMVYEANRLIQTEISINPKISDPCLSDINIISEVDCFELVSEQCRETSRYSSETDSRNREVQSDAEACKNNEVIKQPRLKPTHVTSVNSLQEVYSDINSIKHKKQCDDPIITENFPDNFTIPIQGTNMMLMVTIASNMQASEVKENEFVNQGIETEKLNYIEESTSLVEECTKAVQNDNINLEEINTNKDTGHNSNMIYDDELKAPCEVAGVINKYNIPENKFDTFLLDERKGLPLFNTNTEIVKITSSTETNFNVNEKSQHTDEYNEKLSSYSIKTIDPCVVKKNLPDNLKQLCSCGCSLKSKECKSTFGETKCDNSVVTKEIGIDYSPINIPSDHQTISNCTTNKGIIETSYDDKSNIQEFNKSDRMNVTLGKDIAFQKNVSSEALETLDLKEVNTSDKSDDNKVNCQYKKVSKNFVSGSTDAKGQESCTDSSQTSKSLKISKTKSKDNIILKNVRSVEADNVTDAALNHDPILNMIKDITKRYSKTDIEKSKRKKCFKEILTVLNYLLDTDESSDSKKTIKDYGNSSDSTQVSKDYDNYSNQEGKESNFESKKVVMKEYNFASCQTKTLEDKAVQLTGRKKKSIRPNTDSSNLPTSTDVPETSTDSATCKVLNKIKKECERYHQKRCKSYNGNICEASSSTSAHCEKCRRPHHCSCRSHRCKRPKDDKPKKPIAYNLIIQTSESMISEETIQNECRPLQNIIVKVPSRYNKLEKAPFKEVASKIEQKITTTRSPSYNKNRSRSLPNECEISSSGDLRDKSPARTVRDYLEKNKPDFVKKCSQRQNCLKNISEFR